MYKGYNSKEEIYAIPTKSCEQAADFVLKYINPLYKTGADVGERNKKIEIIEHRLSETGININFDELTSSDFNWKDFEIAKRKYDVITMFDVLEHVQNPLFLMRNVKNRLKHDGMLFLSTPARAHIFYPGFHFHEIPKKHLEEWILKPLGLKILHTSKIRILPKAWWWHFTGIRPFLRIFVNYTYIYHIVKTNSKID